MQGGGSECLTNRTSTALCYQTKCGSLMANSHPGSYCGQDAYNDMFIVEKI